MTKKRKACSPTQDNQSDLCAELKEFIVKENAKCVKEIKDSNERRISAMEDSLSFAMDAISSVSARQTSADRDIRTLQKETAELRSRLQTLELQEDRQSQERRRGCLVFSGPFLQSLHHRADFVQPILSVVGEHMRHRVDPAQIRSAVRFKTGNVMFDFLSWAPGSDRDVLFRSKSRLKGSGLYISEFLTPRRHALFTSLLQLRREKKIFSVFTRAGNILVCRSRDSAPLRVASPEAVRQLSGAGAPGSPEQGRAQVVIGDGGMLRGGSCEGRRRNQESRADTSPPLPGAVRGGEERRSDSSGAPVGRPRPNLSAVSPCGAVGGGLDVGSAAREAGRRSLSSPLLDCAREPVHLVRLSPPLEESSAVGAAPRLSPSGDRGAGEPFEAFSTPSGIVAVADRRSAAPSGTQSAVTRGAERRSLESPLVSVTSEVASPRPPALRTGGRGGRRVAAGREAGAVLPPGGRGEQLTSSETVGDGATGEAYPPKGTGGGSQRGREDRGAGRGGGLSGVDGSRGTRRSQSVGGAGRVGDQSRSRDIRDFF